MKTKIKKWIAKIRKEIIDPDNTKDMNEEYLDEAQQAQIQLLNELEDFLERIK